MPKPKANRDLRTPNANEQRSTTSMASALTTSSIGFIQMQSKATRCMPMPCPPMVKRAPTPTGPEVILTSISAPAIEKFRYGGLRPLMYSNILLPLFRNVTFVWGRRGNSGQVVFIVVDPKMVPRNHCILLNGKRAGVPDEENRKQKPRTDGESLILLLTAAKWGREMEG